MRVKLWTILLGLLLICAANLPSHATAIYQDTFTSDYDTCCHIQPWGFSPPPVPLTQYSGNATVTGSKFATYDFPTQFVEVWMDTSFVAPVSHFTETVDCDSQGLCDYSWGGTFGKGTINIAATVLVLAQSPVYTYLNYSGTITDGTFAGFFTTKCPLTVCWGLESLFLNMNIDGEWNNGWNSSGLLAMYADYEGPRGAAALNTTTPEPSAIALFGSGLTLLAGAIRRKLLH